MVNNFRSWFTAIILVGLFVFAIGNFIVTTQLSNNINDTILNDPNFNSTFTSLQEDLEGIQGKGQSQQDSIDSDVPTKGNTNLILDSASGIRRFVASAISVTDLTFGLIASTIGVSSTVLSVFLGLILLIGGILLIRVIRVGD